MGKVAFEPRKLLHGTPGDRSGDAQQRQTPCATCPGSGLGGSRGSGGAPRPGGTARPGGPARRHGPHRNAGPRPRCAGPGRCPGSSTAAPAAGDAPGTGPAPRRAPGRADARPRRGQRERRGRAASTDVRLAQSKQPLRRLAPPLALPAASLSAPRRLAGVACRKHGLSLPAVARRRALRWLPGGGVCFRERGGVAGVGGLLAAS